MNTIEEAGLTPTRHVPVDDAINGFLQNPGEESFACVFETLYAPLCRYFMVRGLDFCTSEELVQDVLLTVYRRSSAVRNHACFSGWLFQVARNCLLQHLRKRHAFLESITGREGEEFLLGHATSRTQIPEESQLFEWMQGLAEDEREICLMRYMDNLDYDSIAQALGLPMGTVKWKLHRIKTKIAVRLGYLRARAKS